MDREFRLHKIPCKDYWIMSMASDKGKKENGKIYYQLICPNCFQPVHGNPHKIEKYNDKLNKNNVSFIRVPYDGKEYKVFSCSDDNACKKAWMKDRNCDENGYNLKC